MDFRKVFIILAVLVLLIPVTSRADFAVPWSASSTSQGWVFPVKVNGVQPAVVATLFNATSTTATSTFANGIKLTGGCFQMADGNCAGTGSGGGAVDSVTAGNTSLTISPTTGAVVATLNVGNANTWTAQQTIVGAALLVNHSTSTITNLTTVNATSTNATTTGAHNFGAIRINSVHLTDLVGTGLTVSGTQLQTTLGTSISNAELDNSTVSYGGVTLALGGSDATPAFDLQDATNLPIVAGTTGTLSIARGGTNATGYASNVLIGYDGTSFIATGTPKLTVGFISATSTTATSTFTNALAVGTTTTATENTLDVTGSFGCKYASTTATTYTAGNECRILANAVGGAITINLPSASTVLNRTYNISKTDASANTVMIDPNGSDTIDAGNPNCGTCLTAVFNFQNEGLIIQSDGVGNWVTGP